MAPEDEGGTQPLASENGPSAGPAEQGTAPSAPPRQDQGAETGQGGQQPTPAADVESLTAKITSLEQSHKEAMQKITAQAEENKALRERMGAPNMPQVPSPFTPQQAQYAQQQQPMYDESADPYGLQPGVQQQPAHLQPRTVQDLLIEGLYGQVYNLQVETRMGAAEAAVGFDFSPQDRESLLSFMQTAMPGSTDLAAGAKILFHDRSVKAAEKRARDAAMKEVKKAADAAKPEPVGQPGETRMNVKGLSSADAFERLMQHELEAKKA